MTDAKKSKRKSRRKEIGEFVIKMAEGLEGEEKKNGFPEKKRNKGDEHMKKPRN
jgi:hypothetical protein